MDRLGQVLDDFEGDARRVEHLLELIKKFREFGASTVPPGVEDGTVSWEEGALLWKASKQRRTDLPYISGSLLLYLTGRFEYFVRQLVETAAEDISESVSAYSDLPEPMRRGLRSRTLDVAQHPQRFGYDESQADAFLLNLAANLDGRDSTPPKIDAVVLSLTDTNLRSRAIADLMKRIGLENFWKNVGKQSSLKLELETRSDGETATKAQNLLNNLMDDRNRIAHPTSSTTFPDPDQVLVTACFLMVFSKVITELARIHLLKKAEP